MTLREKVAMELYRYEFGWTSWRKCWDKESASFKAKFFKRADRIIALVKEETPCKISMKNCGDV
jgi:hypothetical protein